MSDRSVAEDLRAERNGVARGDGLVRPNLKRELVVVRLVADAGVFHRVVDLEDWGIDGVDRDDTDDLLRKLVLFCGDIAAAVIDDHLHGEITVRAKGGDVVLGVQNLDLAVGRDGAGSDLALAACF